MKVEISTFKVVKDGGKFIDDENEEETEK